MYRGLNVCFRTVGPLVGDKGLGFGVRIGQKELREALNVVTLKLKEQGDLERLERKWWFGTGECWRTKGARRDKHYAHMNFSDVEGIILGCPETAYIFYVLLCGIVLTGIVALLEVVLLPKIKPLL